MSLKQRLNKLEPLAYERWSASWESYMNRTLDRMPEEAIDPLLEVLKSEWPVSPERDAENVSNEHERFAELGLEPAPWYAWYSAAQAAEPAHYKGKNIPYHLTPERVPKPPHNPVDALAATQGWTYPSTSEGRSRAAIALVLAMAVEVSSIGVEGVTP